MNIMIMTSKSTALVLTIGRKLPWGQCVHLIYLVREYYNDRLEIEYADYIFGLFRKV